MLEEPTYTRLSVHTNKAYSSLNCTSYTYPHPSPTSTPRPNFQPDPPPPSSPFLLLLARILHKKPKNFLASRIWERRPIFHTHTLAFSIMHTNNGLLRPAGGRLSFYKKTHLLGQSDEIRIFSDFNRNALHPFCSLAKPICLNAKIQDFSYP